MMFESIETAITAIGALGTSSFALVDASKAFGGGISNAGFRHIQAALAPYKPAMDLATGGDGWSEMLSAHWMNGRALADQKAIARAMVRLGLTADTVATIAAASRVQPDALRAAVAHVQAGETATAADLNVLGRVDAALEMVLDAAYERADQQYRNSARVAAASVSMLLSLLAATALGPTGQTTQECVTWYIQAFFVGLIAVPVAPIAKDLTTSLSTAVNALKAARSVKG